MAPHPPAVATFFAPNLADEATVLEFRGSEALCRPYQFDIHLRVTGMSSREMDEQAAVGSAATLKLRRGADGDEAPFVFQGILSKVAVLVETREWALYRVSLVPRLWQLGLTRHSRVFTKMTVPDILAEVLESADLIQGSDFELRLQGDYPEEELVTMYGESKLAFLHRWMEREGMVYFFEHDPDGEGAAGGDKLIIADHPAAHAALAEAVSVPYRPLADDDDAAGACFDTFAMLRDRVVGAVKLSDYDYARPALELSAEQAVSDGQGFGQMVQHLGRFFDPEQAKRYAQLRAEAIQAREVTYHLAGSAFHLSAGWLVDVAEHARDAHNGRYLVHEVQHMGNQLGDELPPALKRLIQPLTDRVYRAEARTVRSDTPFRPQQTTTWPRVAGYENAIVDGPVDSEYAQIDDQGRYLVQMHFDESELTDGKRSTYVRMMQPHGGQTEGFHFPLRKGTEVKLGFDEGDPDRPFIAGVVPNATTPSPVTKTNHTQNVISTGAGNIITFEDEEAKPSIHVYSPGMNTTFHVGHPMPVSGMEKGYDQPSNELYEASIVLKTDGNAALSTGGSWQINVQNIKREFVGEGVFETYKVFHGTKVIGDRNEEITGDEYITVAGTRTESVASGITEKYGTSHTTHVDGPREEKAAAVTEKYASQMTTVDGLLSYTAGSALFNFGDTALVVGDTAGTVSSVNLLVPGGVNITTPMLQTMDPIFTTMAATYETLTSVKASYNMTKITAVGGLKFTTAAFCLDLYGAKVARAAYKNDDAGYNAQKNGIQDNLIGAFLSKAAAYIFG